MFKTKLQELCQRRGWGLPEYSTNKDGPDHMPRFTASVNVKGQVFESPTIYRSAKEAQNTAARMAFDYLNCPPPPHLPVAQPPPHLPVASVPIVPPVAPVPIVPPVPMPREMQPVATIPQVHPLSPFPSSLPMPPLGLLRAKNDAKIKPINGEALQPNYEDTSRDSEVYRSSINSHDKSYQDTLHMFKNRLQQYAQKQNLGFPVYTNEAEGPPHARCFKSRVSVCGNSYETVEYYSTLKEAEQAVAKVACQFLCVDAVQEDNGLYKNLLQEFAQKKGLLCPSYMTVSSGMSHKPVFVSTIEIGSHTFQGAEAKTKKQAEMNAAKVAYHALAESLIVTESSGASSIKGYPVANNSSIIQSTLMANSSEDMTLPSPTNKKHGDAILPSPVTKKQEDALPSTPVTKKYEDATNKGAQTQMKRPKAIPEKENIDAHSSGLTNGNSAPHNFSSPCSEEKCSSAAETAVEKLEGPLSLRKTVVFPRKSSLPIPEGASVMPYSDDRWVAYRIEPHREPAS